MTTDVGSLIDRPLFWWCAERNAQNISEHLPQIIPHLFKTLDALYLTVKELPNMEIQEGTGRISGGGKTGEQSKTFIIDIPLNPKDYVVFRSCVSLVGDVYHLITPLIKENRLAELLNPLKELMDSADKFRDLRNFLTHIDERFTEKRYNKIEKHSISLTDENGHYESFYFVYSDGIIRFTEFETVKQVPFDVESFKPIFKSAQAVYKVITSHEKYKGEYITHDQLYIL